MLISYYHFVDRFKQFCSKRKYIIFYSLTKCKGSEIFSLFLLLLRFIQFESKRIETWLPIWSFKERQHKRTYYWLSQSCVCRLWTFRRKAIQVINEVEKIKKKKKEKKTRFVVCKLILVDQLIDAINDLHCSF